MHKISNEVINISHHTLHMLLHYLFKDTVSIIHAQTILQSPMKQ